MQIRTLVPVGAALLALASSSPLRAQQTTPARPAAAAARPVAAPKVTEEKAGLFARAKVTPEAATATALARVPGSTMTKGELEEEGGKLIYSFDLKVAGRRGIKEVHVDAMTGVVVNEEDEDDAAAAPTKAPTKAPAATKKP